MKHTIKHILTVSFISGLVFGIIAVLHVWRLISGWEAQIGGLAIPMWASGIAVVLSALLSVANFVHCHKCAR